MTDHVETLSADTNLCEAQQQFQRSTHTGFPVCKGDRPIGVMTRGDLVQALEARSPETTRVASVIGPELITIGPDESLQHVWATMAERQIGSLVVVSSDQPDHLLGIVSRSDLLQVANPQFSEGFPEGSD